MPGEFDWPLVEVSVVLAVDDRGRVLLTLNPQWGEFTLPMTKRRSWSDPKTAAGVRAEDWPAAAARAAAEAYGRTFDPAELTGPVLEVASWDQSDRDGRYKRYHFQVFPLRRPAAAKVAAGVAAEWLTPDEVDRRVPVSPTARFLVGKLKAEGRV